MPADRGTPVAAGPVIRPPAPKVSALTPQPAYVKPATPAQRTAATSTYRQAFGSPAQAAPPPLQHLASAIANVSKAAKHVSAATGIPKAEVSLRTKLAKALVGSYKDGAFTSPSELIAAPPLGTSAFQQVAMEGIFKQDFSELKQAGLLPRSAALPTLTFAPGLGAGGQLSSEVGSGRNATVNVSPAEVMAATGASYGAVPGALGAWGQQVPIHEIAHSAQLPQVKSSRLLREGGAQAFADAAAVKILGPIVPQDSNYTSYVRQVRRRGPEWYMRAQFGR